jgi:hypothetical protein
MKHGFRIERKVKTSAGNVIANYLDFEHTVYHSDFAQAQILGETDVAACIETVVRKGPFRFVNIAYAEYRPPNGLFQIQKTILGSLRNLVIVEEHESGTPAVWSHIVSHVEHDMPAFLFPFRGLIEWWIRRTADSIFEEDRLILERRDRLLGDSIEDYLRPEQLMLFKKAFARSFSRRTEGESGTAAG